MLMQRTVEKAASQISYEAANLSSKRREVTTSLLKSLRYNVNRRRNSARLLGYRTLGVYMDTEVERASIERVVSTPASTAGGGADDGFSDPLSQDSTIGYQLRSKKNKRIDPKAISPMFFASAPQKISEETARLV